MLKILNARLQHYENQELPDVQAGFRKGRGTRDQIANICWIIEKVRELQKNISLCFIDYDCMDHDKLRKPLREMGIPAHLTCLLRNLHAGQEATLRTLCGTTSWFRDQERSMTVLSSVTLFNQHVGHVMRNAGLDELQAGIKIGINNLRHGDDIL